jgi:flavin reductase (DIM6/NTAB) family NADH-FMN oxidoreductase RutF
MFFDASTLSSRDAYRLMIGSVVPRPIAWVSTVSADGRGNLAPFSFFTAITAAPPTLCFSQSHRAGRLKDTVRNIRETREFVVNVVNEDVAEAMNATSEETPPDVDELLVAKLTPAPSTLVGPHGVAEAPIRMECRLDRLVEVGGADGATLVLGQIVAWHIRDELFDAERLRIRIDRLHAIGRMTGDWYTRTHDQFEMVRPNPSYQGR